MDLPRGGTRKGEQCASSLPLRFAQSKKALIMAIYIQKCARGCMESNATG